MELATYAGAYENELYGEIKVILKDGSLEVRAGPAQYTGTLTHVNYDTFHLSWPILINLPDEVNFVINAEGKVRELITDSIGTFRRVD